MGLPVRLRHALGERVLELPDRGVDDPLVVGRAGDADLKIPSINVGGRHLVLFVHEGHWVAQPGPDNTATSLNGAPLTAARALQGGDVLALGSEANAPTIEVDPDGVATGPVAAPAAAPAHAAAPAARAPYRPAPPPPSAAVAQPPAPIYAEAGAAGEPASDDGTSWMTEQSTPRSYYVPKRRKSSDAAVAFAVVGALAIVAGAGVFVYMQKQKAAQNAAVVPQAAPKRNPAAADDEPPSSGPSTGNIFTGERPRPTVRRPPPPPDLTDDAPPARTPPIVTTRAASAGAPATSPAPEVPDSQSTGGNGKPDMADDAPSAEAERAFKRVESAYYNPDPAKALMAFDAYVEEFPNVHKREIEQYREDMLDKIWWERIDRLFEKRKELAAAIRKTEQDIKDETEAAFKKTVLEPRLADQKKRLATVGERLTKEMAYTLPTPPKIGHDKEMRALRDKRDPIVYEQWKAAVLKHVRSTRGSYPWVNEK